MEKHMEVTFSLIYYHILLYIHGPRDWDIFTDLLH